MQKIGGAVLLSLRNIFHGFLNKFNSVFKAKSPVLSPHHSRFILLLLLSLALNLAPFTSTAIAATANLAWDANSEPELAGYRVYYGTASKDYATAVDVGNTTAYTVANIEEGTTYYFAVTAYDIHDNETGFSNEAAFSTNQPPTAEAGADQSVNESVVVKLSAFGSSDPDDGIESYSWQQVGGTEVSLSNPTASETIFVSPDVGQKGEALTFQLTVSDRAGRLDTDTCSVYVVDTADPEVLADFDRFTRRAGRPGGVVSMVGGSPYSITVVKVRPAELGSRVRASAPCSAAVLPTAAKPVPNHCRTRAGLSGPAACHRASGSRAALRSHERLVPPRPGRSARS